MVTGCGTLPASVEELLGELDRIGKEVRDKVKSRLLQDPESIRKALREPTSVLCKQIRDNGGWIPEMEDAVRAWMLDTREQLLGGN